MFKWREYLINLASELEYIWVLLGAPSIIAGAPNIFSKYQNCPSFVLGVRERMVHKRLTDQVDPYVDILSIRIKLIHMLIFYLIRKLFTDQLDPYVDILNIWINLICKILTDQVDS